VIGDLAPTGLRPSFLHKFRRHGIELPDDMFGSAATAMFGVNGDEPTSNWMRTEGA
jgi:hypothetical protein